MSTTYSFSPEVTAIFDLIKSEGYRGKDFAIPVYQDTSWVATLKPITRTFFQDRRSNETIRLLTEWRRSNERWYPSVFTVTEERTRAWLQKYVLDNHQRILFVLEKPDGEMFGHMGLSEGEIDNVLRGKKQVVKGGMTAGLQSLMKWSYEELKIKNLYLRVFSDNPDAIHYYKNSGFLEIDRIPLKKIEENNETKWVESEETDIPSAERIFCVMRIDLEETFAEL